MVLALLLAVLRPEIAEAAPHTFAGVCHTTGVVSFMSYGGMDYTFAGKGTCSGLLDGAPVQEAVTRVKSKGDVMAFMVPVVGSAMGTITFTKQKITFPIGIQQIGLTLRVFVACHGCTGSAVGGFEPFSQTQPEGDPMMGPRTAIRIVTQTTQTFAR